MYTVILILHIIVAVLLVGIILIQRSDADGLLTGSGNNMFSGRSTANFLTRVTAVLATIFIFSSLGLSMYAHKQPSGDIADKISAVDDVTPATKNDATAVEKSDKADKKATEKNSDKKPAHAKPVVPTVPKPE